MNPFTMPDLDPELNGKPGDLRRSSKRGQDPDLRDGTSQEAVSLLYALQHQQQ